MHLPKLLVLDDYEGQLRVAPAMEKLKQLADVTILDHPLAADELPQLRNVQMLLTLRERTQLNENLFKFCHKLELILQTGGHVYHLDESAATKRGIVVALGRRVTRPPVVVPELVFGFMLGLIRRLYPLTNQMASGQWPISMGSSLAGRTLGILGYGRHGRPVARLARAFHMKVIAWDRGVSYHSDDSEVVRMPLDDLLAAADIVSIHLRLSQESRGLINRDRIGKMKPGSFLINTSRGAIIEEDALADALREKRIAGAGLDVFAIEPLPASSPLRTLPNVLLTPHIGWQVDDVLHEFVAVAAEQLRLWLEGRLPIKEVVNPGAIKVSRARTGGLTREPSLKPN
jgi:phosphoglycerate dehydrogenase-like enzyme